MPAPACVRARDVPDPRFAPVLWMGTKTRRALRRHSARQSSRPSFRPDHRLTGLSSGFPCEVPRSGGRREVSPLCPRHRRTDEGGPEGLRSPSRDASMALQRPVSANGHRSSRIDRLARPGPVPAVSEPSPLTCRSRSGVADLLRPSPRCRVEDSEGRGHRYTPHERAADRPPAGAGGVMALMALATTAPASNRSGDRPSAGRRDEAANSSSRV